MLRNIKQKVSPKLGQRGQSLVEMAIAAPLLILMLIGVFEVGWAIRGYLVLSNVNRESVRYAVKAGTLDFSTRNPAIIGYDKVLSHTTASLSRQLPLEYLGDNPNSSVIMSHLVADTGYPCVRYQGGAPRVPYEFDPACDCTVDDPNHPQWFTRDDLVLHPGLPGYAYYAQTYGLSRTTRLGGGNYQVAADKLKVENNRFNCTVLKTGSSGELSSNNMFIAEAFYDQPQIFGVPFISNRLTDPIPFYAHTAMRIVCARDGCSDAVGPACEVYPITFHDGIFDNPANPLPGQAIDAFEGDGEGNFGWLNWNPGDNSNGYIIEELFNPRLATHDFVGLTPPPGLNPDPTNTRLNQGDWVSGSTGVSNSSGVQQQLANLEGKTIRVPIYNTASSTGSNKGYHISHFALITINRVCLPSNQCGQNLNLNGSDKAIFATFVGYDDEACME